MTSFSFNIRLAPLFTFLAIFASTFIAGSNAAIIFSSPVNPTTVVETSTQSCNWFIQPEGFPPYNSLATVQLVDSSNQVVTTIAERISVGSGTASFNIIPGQLPRNTPLFCRVITVDSVPGFDATSPGFFVIETLP